MCVGGVGGVGVDTYLSISGVFSISTSVVVSVVVNAVVSVIIRNNISDSRSGTAAAAARGTRKHDAKEAQEGGAGRGMKTTALLARVRSGIRTS